MNDDDGDGGDDGRATALSGREVKKPHPFVFW